MLPKPLRLSAQRDFARVFRKGGSLSTPLFSVRATVAPRTRIGIVVSNKISKKATVRNLIKRRLRASVYEHRSELTTPFDIAIIAKPAIVEASFQDIDSQVVRMITKLNTVIPPTPRSV